MNENEFYAFMVSVVIVACFLIKFASQTNLKTKQMIHDCYVQTQAKECFDIRK